MNVIQRFGAALKAAATSFVMSFGRTGGGWGSWGRGGTGNIDYARLVGNGRNSSIVASVLGWLGRKFPNGVLSLRVIKADGSKDVVVSHPFLALMKRPNDFYSGSTMLVAAHADWTFGNAYLLKVRNGLESPVQLWYAPSSTITPVSDDPNVFVQYYKYTPGDKEYRLRPEDVVHIRNGIDPDNVRLGLSPLGAIVREIFTDAEASQYTAAMLKNSGIPRVIISPDGDSEIPPDEAGDIKNTYTERFAGANRGSPLVLTSKIKITPLSFNPTEMDLSKLRATAEERITGVLGLPAIVAGMGAGLAQSAYANVTTLREVAIEDNLLPTYYVFAEALAAQLLPDFEDNPDQFEVYFDVSGIRELQPDQDKLAERAVRELAGGLATLDEARAMVGKDALNGAAGKVIYLPINVTPTALDAIIPLALPEPAPTPTPTAGKALDEIETKALGVMQSIVRLRGRLLDPETRALAGLLRKQRDMAISVLDDVTKAGPVLDLDQSIGLETKETDPAVFEARLNTRLRSTFEKGTQTELERVHLRAALGVHDLVGQWAGVDLPVDARLRQFYLREAGNSVTGMTDYTLEALNKTIRASVFAGETIEETTARIQGLHVFSDARAHTIAYNELAQATNRASIQSYGQSGIVEEIEVSDGTENDAECAAMNGRRFSLEDIGSVDMQEHVNCVRQFLPVVRAARGASGLSNGHVGHKELVAV